MSPEPNINLKIDNRKINQVNEVKFLGTPIDSSLKWKAHIEDVKIKLSRITGLLYHIIKQVYFALA